jgi:phage-related tail fiber protein
MTKPSNLRIEDVAAATARADLNDILVSIAYLQTTDGDGVGYTGEPTTTYPNMLWYDKATDLLKMRSEADDAWITIGALDQSANKFFAEGGVPAGTVIYQAASTAPDGYLKANGAAISRTTYSDLFSAIGTTYGSGDGSTTFNLPDLRGEFIRSWDDSRGVDSGRAFASSQGQSTEDLYAQITMPNVTVMRRISTPTYSVNFRDDDAGGGTSGTRDTGAGVGSLGTGETRPRNVALLACIKY